MEGKDRYNTCKDGIARKSASSACESESEFEFEVEAAAAFESGCEEGRVESPSLSESGADGCRCCRSSSAVAAAAAVASIASLRREEEEAVVKVEIICKDLAILAAPVFG